MKTSVNDFTTDSQVTTRMIIIAREREGGREGEERRERKGGRHKVQFP